MLLMKDTCNPLYLEKSSIVTAEDVCRAGPLLCVCLGDTPNNASINSNWKNSDLVF